MSNNQEEFQAKTQKPRRYYTPYDVSLHFKSGDLWVVIFGEVFNLTSLVQSNIQSTLCQPLIDNAGKDISHFFNSKTKEPLTRIDAKTGKQVYYCPYGRFLHIPSIEATTHQEPVAEIPWWRDRNYVIGKLSQKVRRLRIINMLTHQ